MKKFSPGDDDDYHTPTHYGETLPPTLIVRPSIYKTGRWDPKYEEMNKGFINKPTHDQRYEHLHEFGYESIIMNNLLWHYTDPWRHMGGRLHYKLEGQKIGENHELGDDESQAEEIEDTEDEGISCRGF